MNYFKFLLDGNRVSDPKEWKDVAINIERDTALNGIFTTYTEKLTFIDDGYNYLISLIDDQDFCGEVRFSMHEYINEGRSGFAFEGIIDLSNAEIDREKGEITLSVEEDTLINVFKKYSSIEVPINNLPGETLNGESIADIGTVANFIFNANGFWPFLPPYPLLSGGNVFVFLKYPDLLQYMLSYISDNQIEIVSDLLNTNEFKPYMAQINFNALGGGDTSVITWTAFNGDQETFTLAGPQTANQHAVAFLQQVIYHFSENSNADVVANDLSTFPSATLSSTSLGVRIVLFHNPDFDLGSFATFAAAERPFTDGAANCGFTTPYFIQRRDLGNATIILNFDDIYKDFAETFDAEITFKNSGGYKCYIEKRSDFINNATPTLTLYEEDISGYKERYADDIIFRALRYQQGSKDEQVGLFKKAEWVYDNCGVKNKQVTLKYKYGYWGHAQALTSTGDLEDTYLAARTDDYLGQEHWDAVYLTGYDDTNNQYQVYSPVRYLAGDYAIHPLIVKRRLETVKATARFNGYELSNDNEFRILREIEFNYPLQYSEFQAIADDPSSPLMIIYTTGQEKKAWIKKIKYNVLTGLTNFELYTS